MSDIGWGRHALILAALVVNLWVGGDLIEAWLGHGVRAAFELLLILGYITLIVGIQPWKRRRDEGDDRRP